MSSDFSNFQNKLNSTETIIDYCFTLLALPIGVLLNFLAAFLFRRKNLNKTNMGFFYSWTSLLNAFTLLFYLLVVKSKLFFGYDLATLNDASCQAILLIKRSTRPLVPWFLVLLSVERFVSLKCKNKSSFKWAYLGIFFGILLVLFLSNTINLYFYVEQTNTTLIESLNENYNETKVTLTARCSASGYVLFTSDMISAMVGTTLPLIFLIGLELIIISKLIIKIKFFGKTDKKSIRTHRRENHFTFTVIVLCILFILFKVPALVCYTIKNIYASISAQNAYTSAIIELVSLKSYEISNFYYGSFFFINFIFNSLFRRECFLILSELYAKMKGNLVKFL